MRRLGHSSNAKTLPPGDDLQLCDHCRRTDNYETDSYFTSCHTQQYSRRLPIRIAWSANNTQYNSDFTSESHPRSMVIFLDDSDTGKMVGFHSGRGRQSSQSVPLPTSRSKPADPIQNGDINSVLRGVRRDPGMRELCRVECEAQHGKKTLVAAHEAGRQNSGAVKGAQIEPRTSGSLKNNPKKMTTILKVEPQPSNKITSVAEPLQRSENSMAMARDTGCCLDSHRVIGERSIPTPLVHSPNMNVNCKVRIVHEPGTSAEKPSLQSANGLVAPSDVGKQDSGEATGAQKALPAVDSLRNRANGVTPTIKCSTTAPLQPSVLQFLVPVSNSRDFCGVKPKETPLQIEMSSFTPCGPSRENSGACAGAHREQPTVDSFKNNATVMIPVVGSFTTAPLETSAASFLVPFSNLHILSFGPKLTNHTTSFGKPSQQSEKSLANNGSGIPDSHSSICQRSVSTVLVNSPNLNVNCNVQIACEPGISVDKSSLQSEKSLVTPCEAGRHGSGTGNGAQKEQTTGGALKNACARKVTPCRSSAVTIPTQTSSPRLHVAVSNSGDHPSGTKPEPNCVDKPSQQREKSLVTARHTGHFRDSCSLVGQSSIPPTFVHLSNLNVTCKVQIGHKPGSCVDKQSQKSEKSFIATHETRKQNSCTAMRARRAQPIGGSLKKSIKKVTPCLWWSATTTPVQTLAARTFVSVSKTGVHSSGTKLEWTNKTTPVGISEARSPVPFSNSCVSFDTKSDLTNVSTSLEKPSQQSEKNLVTENDTSDLPGNQSLIGQSSIPPAFMHPSNLNVSCNVQIAHEPGTTVDKPSQQSEENLVVAHAASRQNSGAVTGSQSKQPADGSLKNSATKETPYVWWSAATTPAQPFAARSLVPVSNFGGHPSGMRLEQTSKTTSMDNPSHQIEKIPLTSCDTGHFPVSHSSVGQSSVPISTMVQRSSKRNVNVQITYKPGYSVDKPQQINKSQQSEKSLVPVHEVGRLSSGSTMGAQREQPMDGSLLSVSNLSINPTDTKPEQTNKTTSVSNPSEWSEKSLAAGLDTGLIGQSSIPAALTHLPDLNYRCRVRIARLCGYVQEGKASSAQGVKGSHRYATHLNYLIYFQSNKQNLT